MSDARYWRGLDEQVGGSRSGPTGEFPPGADRLPPVTRRDFGRLLGASLALAGLAGCTRPPRERIYPYVREPREQTPGIPSDYATAMTLDGYATGLLVTSHVGRPTKVEGNPDHPASLGAAGVLEQALLLGLYDPDRARLVTHEGRASSWPAFVDAGRRLAARHRTDRGRGLRFLLEPTASPLVAHLASEVRAAYPEASAHVHAPLAAPGPLAGSRLAFGRPLESLYDLGRADVVAVFDADPLASGPFHLRYARQFADRRRVAGPDAAMSRLYAVETAFSVTGGAADHRLPVRPSEVSRVLGAVLAEVALDAPARPGGLPAEALAALERLRRDAPHRSFARAVARDLRARPGRGLVVVGARQPAEAHAMGHLLNALLGSAGGAVRQVEPFVLGAGEQAMGLAPLAEALSAGAVETLVILEGNPAYAAPADLELPARIAAAPNTIRLGLHADETARVCRWVVPAAHDLETWGDARAADGTLSFVQPLVEPLYGGKTVAELLAVFLGDGTASAHDLVRDLHRARLGGADFDPFFERALARGVVPETEAPVVPAAPRWADAPAWLHAALEPASSGLELALAPDAKVHDGRFANNAWLAELPDPMTKLTWDNAAVMSPATAARLGVDTERVVELRYGGRTLAAPALVLPGHADGAVSIALGYGRELAGAVAAGAGVNAYRLLPSGGPAFFGPGLEVVPLTEAVRVTPGLPPRERPMRRRLAVTQSHFRLEGRPVALAATLDEFRRDPDFTAGYRGALPSLHPPWPEEGPQWGMTIDLGVCTGCSACVVACQAENNVPTVGREEVLNSREMHWLRIDRYFTGPAEAPRVVMEPMLCQHCEKAPCEYVCPVNATVHSPDGLNEMVYGRCIGTRFCSNNCPWKVRRFNWFDYNATTSDVEALAMNPDVTVRQRGVMEKCTFCVQRIRRAGIEARREGGGDPAEVVTACQQACPTRAIVFGSLADPASPVARTRARPHRFAVLHHLGTRPRVEYLARITNPNEALG